MSEATQPSGPDLRAGIPETALADGCMLAGHAGDEAVLIARRGQEVFAIGATCTHYGGPLPEGLMVGETVRCPWHHACFSLRTGEALAAPALSPVSCWRVERREGRLFVPEKAPEKAARRGAPSPSAASATDRIVIIGGGAAGFAAAQMLRRESFGGPITLISADDSAPYDRPNLSKDYLAGTAPEEWMPLRPEGFYRDNDIDLRLGTEAKRLDVAGRRVTLANGETLPFTKMLLATGAEPVRLQCPGADLPHVRTLRSLADCRSIRDRATPGTRA
ncbi:MAG: FAD-dependent oxidoreductase, partial [Steroidobacteraceae bacterium]